jgi:hypothetical protein
MVASVLIAVEKLEGDESVIELRHGRAGGDGVLVETAEGGGAGGEVVGSVPLSQR